MLASKGDYRVRLRRRFTAQFALDDVSSHVRVGIATVSSALTAPARTQIYATTSASCKCWSRQRLQRHHRRAIGDRSAAHAIRCNYCMRCNAWWIRQGACEARPESGNAPSAWGNQVSSPLTVDRPGHVGAARVRSPGYASALAESLHSRPLSSLSPRTTS